MATHVGLNFSHALLVPERPAYKLKRYWILLPALRILDPPMEGFEPV